MTPVSIKIQPRGVHGPPHRGVPGLGDHLADQKAQVRIAARLRQAEAGNLGDWASVGGEVSELRVHFGPGYRLYFTRRGGVLIIMLAGGNKGSRARDIQRAQRIATELGKVP